MSDLDGHIDVENPHDLDYDHELFGGGRGGSGSDDDGSGGGDDGSGDGNAGTGFSSSGTNPSKRRLAPFVALAVAVVMIGLFVLLAGSKTRQNAETAATPLLAKPAPQFQSPMLAGGTFDLASQRGNVVILNFFTSNCVPCIAEQPELVKFANAEMVRVGGAKLVSVMFDDSPDAATKFFTSTGGAWPVLNDKGLPSNYGVAQVPETFVIDVNGIVKYHTISQMTAACLTSMAASAQDLNSLQFDALPGCGQ